MKRPPLFEAFAVTAIAVALIAAVVLISPAVPFVAENTASFVAIVLIYLPLFVIRWRRREYRDFGLTTRGALRGAAYVIPLALATLPPYSVGFHIWQEEVFTARADFSLSNYLRWPRHIEGPPVQFDATHAHVWVSRGDLSIQVPKLVRANVTIAGTTVVRSGTALENGADVIIPARAREHAVTLDAKRIKRFSVRFLEGETTLDKSRIRIGPTGNTPDAPDVQVARDLGWLINLFLAQFLLVALSEEIFFRGYLQTRLDEAFPPRRTFLGATVGWGLLATSALFALTHVVSHGTPVVLAVFFPSLAFGWLRAKTGSIIAPIIFHGLCNIWVQLLSVHYIPR
ncbi:MAG: CPBP family intramembrane metalloprotease [Deltaproteobacteria bacterium]|nr:CPBP family intramembrane metalloprotease [Deltaproteobacteria bacterium]